MFRILSFLFLAGSFVFAYREKRIVITLSRVLLLSILLTVYSVFSMRNLEFSGDEPHYLLLTKSIIYDGDLDVSNQFLEKQWKEFYVKEDVKLLPHAHAVKGGWYSIHLPGLSYMLIPFYLASKPFPAEIKKIIIRLGFSIYGLLFLFVLFHFLKGEFEEEVALKALAIIALTVPAFPFFFHLFPEIPAALLTISSLYIVLYKKKWWFMIAGVLSGALIWFGIKYFIFTLMLVLVSLVIKRRETIFLIIAQAFPVVPFFAYLKAHYGTYSMLSVYYGFLTPERKAELIRLIIYKIPLELRIGSFLDYFLDQRDGLLPYAPVAIFAFAALLRFWKKRPALISLAFFLPFVFNYGWQTHRGGYCPPARPLASLVWVIAVGYALFIEKAKNKNLRFLFWSMFSLSLLLSVLLSSIPYAYYGPTTHEVANRAGLLFHKLSTPLFYLPNYLPSFLKHPSAPITKWMPNYVWTVLLLLFMAFIIKFMVKEGKRDNRKLIAGIMLFLLLPFFLLPEIPLSRGRLIMGRNGRVLVYNWKQIEGRCVKLLQDQAVVFITSYTLEVKGNGVIVLQDYIKKKVEGKVFIDPEKIPHFRINGGILVHVKLTEGDSILVCP